MATTKKTPVEHGLNEFGGMSKFCRRGYHRQTGDRFGRLFPDLPPLYTKPDTLQKVGHPQGPMQDEEESANTRTKTVDVGLIFFGQFVDHDITLDTTSSLSRNATPEAIQNIRTPSLDLDCIYGAGPEASPYLYHSKTEDAGVKLLTGADLPDKQQNMDEAELKLLHSDLARSLHGTAVIGDARNDENRIISQIQLSMIRAHNKIVDEISSDYKGHELFEEARKMLTWHYQWAVVNDFLVNICGSAVVERILGEGRKHYCLSGEAFIPIEFSAAAYRFGHSMIPQTLQIQKGDSSLDLFGSLLGRGFSPLSDRRAVPDWEELFDLSTGRKVQKSEKLNLKMSKNLLNLPIIPEGEKSLATRNISRGQVFMLPSGESIAKQLERPKSEIDLVSERVQQMLPGDLNTGSPLWLYLLAEAEMVGKETSPGQFEVSEGLGPVGATLVAETLIGLIELDHDSWLGQNRNWTPHTANGGLGMTTVGELLTYPGPVPCLT